MQLFCTGILKAEPEAFKWPCASVMHLLEGAHTHTHTASPTFMHTGRVHPPTPLICTNLCHLYSQTRENLCIYFSLELDYETQVNTLKCHLLIPHIKGKLFLTCFPPILFNELPRMLPVPSFICRAQAQYKKNFIFLVLKNGKKKAGEIFWKSIKILCTFSFFNDKLSY